jgi:hypothetical protein
MKYILIGICSLLPLIAFTQVKHLNHHLLELELEAEESFNNRQFGDALKYYLQYEVIANDMTVEIHYKMGISFLETSHFSKALEYLIKCEDKSSLLDFSYHYYFAKALHLNNKLNEAISHYSIYLVAIENDKDYQQFTKEIKAEIVRCEYGLLAISNPVNVKIKLMDGEINSLYDDHSPLVTADGSQLFFTSDRPITKVEYEFHNDSDEYEKIYTVENIEGEWSAPKIIQELDSKHHNACVALSHDGYQMIIYRSTHKNIFHNVSGNLYLTKKVGGLWMEPKILPLSLSTSDRILGACFSINDKEIYFTSDYEGGYGGTDIYRTEIKEDGSWSKPVNLGNVINTEYDEDAPFIHPDGNVLYFSSTGHTSIGGFDIFQSVISEKQMFGQPENFGYPINTTADDMSFSVSGDGKEIYFADSRGEDSGDMNIYTAEYYDKIEDLYVLKGKVLNGESGEAVEAVIKVYEGNDQSVHSIYSSNSLNGEFVIILNEGKKYTLEINKEGYEVFIEEIHTELLDGFNEATKDLILKKRK